MELRHYDVQLIGGMILHDGRLAEMATGEGKTLVSTLPVYLNALTGNTAFVITVNDYLARRDMEKMGQVHRFLGLSVGLIQAGMTTEQRRAAYQSDVVYVTNAELGFDYLRDNLALSTEQSVLPTRLEDCFCVVDEADSVLIDEARTPLILSEQVPAPANKYKLASQLAQALKADVHYKVDLKNKNVVLNQAGYEDSENALRIQNLFALEADGEAWAPFVANAVKAKELFKKDVDYTILKDASGNPNGVGIIDSFTGRVLDGRRWSDGLHQSIEAMEDIEVSKRSKVIAKVTYQALFRSFSRLSGMTGTAVSDAAEFGNMYGLTVTPVPTALPVARRDYPDVAFRTREAANKALIDEIVNVGGGKEGGRPCLVGTTSVAQSEMLLEALAEEGIKAELLNASPENAPRESEIIAQAGRAGVVTVATNMAGRGTDILLGGCPTTMSRIKTRAVLLDNGVLSSEEAATLAPSPNEDYFPAPVSDDVTAILSNVASSIKSTFGGDLTGVGLEEILTIAFDTTEAEDEPAYVEQLREAAALIQENYGSILSEEKEIVKNLGGLYVMGTCRHESSRIDQQLRGRAGRQGDPGTSRFFVSFEDEMFVVFGGDKLQNMLKMFRVSDNMPVEAPQVTEALDKVQRAVEEKYRNIREEIFRFDETLNLQRRVIYEQRRNIVRASPADSVETISKYNTETIEEIVTAQTDENGVVDTPKVLEKTTQFFPSLASVMTVEDIADFDASATTKYITVAVDELFQAQVKELDARALSAGKASGSLGRSANYIILVTLDNAWSDHLQAMENLKETVSMKQYQGLNPLNEYQNESYELFQGLQDTMRRNAVFSLWQSLAPAKQAA